MDPRDRYRSDDTRWLGAPDPVVEGQWVERKESFQAGEIARQISAFANGQPPGGLIVVGVKKDGATVGVRARLPGLNDGLGRLADQVDSCGWTHRFVAVKEGQDQVLYIYVPISDQRVICLSDGTAYRRLGSSSVELSSVEIQELRYARGEVSFEMEPILPYRSEHLDEELAKSLLEEMTRRNGLTLPLTLDSALRNRSLVRTTERGDYLTVAGLLSVGRDPAAVLPGARLRFLRFEGKEERFGTERNVIKDEWFDGPIPRLVPVFREFLRAQARDFDYLGSDGRFVHEPEYPQFAWEEAVVNALVHRSYSLRNAVVFVRMFEDRIEVESPGGFPGTVTPENLYSFPRNPKLCGALQYFQLVRLAHEGTRRMKQEMEQLGLPAPTLQEINASRVVVILRNDIERRRARREDKLLEERGHTLAEQLADSLAIVRKNALKQLEESQKVGAAIPQVVAVSLADLLRRRDISLEERVLAARMLVNSPDHLSKVFRENLDPKMLEEVSGMILSALRTVGTYDDEPSQFDTLFQTTGFERWLEDQGDLRLFLHEAERRLARSPFPNRSILERLVRLCESHPEMPEAQSLYRTITGHDMTAKAPS